jgi:hypothetical protein
MIPCTRALALAAALALLAGCGGGSGSGPGSVGSGGSGSGLGSIGSGAGTGQGGQPARQADPLADRETIWDLFGNTDTDTQINVNKHLWAASLDVLSFLPIEAADPFSGVIATGWGRVGGSGTAHRVTVYVTSPALDARSLRVAVFRGGGGTGTAVADSVSAEIEDAILTRARELRIAEFGRR